MPRRKPTVVVISGVDGSGKSVIVRELKRVLEEQGHRTYTPWLRYNHYLTRGVFALGKLLGLYSYDVNNGRRVAAYHEFWRSRWVSVLFVTTSFIDTLFASLAKVYFPAYVLGRTVICDRWIPDILVDIAVDLGRKKLQKDFLWRTFWRLVPSGANAFVVMRDRRDVLGCREENRLNREFDLRFHLYKDLCVLGPPRAVDNSGSVERSVEQIMEAAFSQLV